MSGSERKPVQKKTKVEHSTLVDVDSPDDFPWEGTTSGKPLSRETISGDSAYVVIDNPDDF